MRSFEVSLDPADYEAELRKMVTVIRPDWNQDNLRLKVSPSYCNNSRYVFRTFYLHSKMLNT